MEFKPAKKLGFGLMRLPQNDKNNSADVDVEQVKKMVDLFLERGFTYFDTALMYNGFASEAVVKEALTDRYPRESFTLATKLHAGFFNSFEERDTVFEGQLKKTGVEYFDYYLLHGIEASMLGKYEKFDCFNWLLEKKAAGLVRHAGFSFHDTPEVLERLLTGYEVAERHGKSVIVMEPVKGGTLANLPEAAAKLFTGRDPSASLPSWAIRFAASLPNVMVVLSGMSTLAQMNDNTAFMSDFRPLTQEERELCFKAAEIINAQIAIPCTACHYCTEGCPQHICIPEYFSIYNEDMRENLEEKGWTINFSNYQILASKFGKASDCVECGQCEGVCPQHLPIIDRLKDVAKHYE